MLAFVLLYINCQ